MAQSRNAAAFRIASILSNIDLPTAIELLSLPRRIGKHPLTDKVVNAGIGRFGPYVTHDKVFGSFDKKTHTYEFEGETYNVLNITMDAAVELLRNTKEASGPNTTAGTRQSSGR